MSRSAGSSHWRPTWNLQTRRPDNPCLLQHKNTFSRDYCCDFRYSYRWHCSVSTWSGLLFQASWLFCQYTRCSWCRPTSSSVDGLDDYGSWFIVHRSVRAFGSLASDSWREAWRLSSKVRAGTFRGQRQGWNTAKRTPWQCTASVCTV